METTYRQEPVHQEQEDPRIEKALNVKNVMQTIKRMNHEDLKKTSAEKKDAMEELARSQPMVGVSGHVTLSCNQWRNTAFHLYVVFMQFLKVYSYVKKNIFCYTQLKNLYILLHFNFLEVPVSRF